MPPEPGEIRHEAHLELDRAQAVHRFVSGEKPLRTARIEKRAERRARRLSLRVRGKPVDEAPSLRNEHGRERLQELGSDAREKFVFAEEKLRFGFFFRHGDDSKLVAQGRRCREPRRVKELFARGDGKDLHRFEASAREKERLDFGERHALAFNLGDAVRAAEKREGGTGLVDAEPNGVVADRPAAVGEVARLERDAADAFARDRVRCAPVSRSVRSIRIIERHRRFNARHRTPGRRRNGRGKQMRQKVCLIKFAEALRRALVRFIFKGAHAARDAARFGGAEHFKRPMPEGKARMPRRFCGERPRRG